MIHPQQVEAQFSVGDSVFYTSGTELFEKTIIQRQIITTGENTVINYFLQGLGNIPHVETELFATGEEAVNDLAQRILNAFNA